MSADEPTTEELDAINPEFVQKALDHSDRLHAIVDSAERAQEAWMNIPEHKRKLIYYGAGKPDDPFWGALSDLFLAVNGKKK